MKILRGKSKAVVLTSILLQAGCAQLYNFQDLVHYVPFDHSTSPGSRILRRCNYPDTLIEPQALSSPQWLTSCPVALESIGNADDPQICIQSNVLDDATLNIWQGGSSLHFNLSNPGETLTGELVPVMNPHPNTNEVVWLKSSGVTSTNSSSTNLGFDFYVFLQNKNGAKYYLVEAFQHNDTSCRNAHLPGLNTLCTNQILQGQSGLQGIECQLNPSLTPRQMVNACTRILPYQPEKDVSISVRKNVGTEVTQNPPDSELQKSKAQPVTPSSAPTHEANQARNPIVEWPPSPGPGYQNGSGGGHEPPVCKTVSLVR